jgi:alpha-glucosidase (family GH31 glycosyl hydrolase)
LTLLGILAGLLLSAAGGLCQIGDYNGHEVTGTGLSVRAGGDTLVFSLYAPDIVRVDFRPGGAGLADSTPAVIRLPSDSVPFEVQDTGDSLVLGTSAFEAIIAKYPVRISYHDAGGTEILSEPASGGMIASGTLRRAAFDLPEDLHFYGTGQRGIGIDLRGHSFGTYNTPSYGYSGPLETMGINIPFLATSSGYALYFESPVPADIDLGEYNPSIFTYDIYDGELSYFFLAGEDVPAQLERYTWLTGRQPLPPKWALGYIQSKYGYRNRAEAEAMVATMRSRNIPADAIVLDLFWFNQMGDLAWNQSAFPDPSAMIDDFLAQGFKTIVITEPYFTEYCVNYPLLTGSASDFVGQAPWGGPYYLGGWWSCGCDAVLFDMTNPDARSWLWERHEEFMDEGVAGLWTDLGEPENHPWEMEHFGGHTRVVHNIYNLLWARTLYEGFAEYRPGERIVNLSRSGYAGIQRYGVFTWSGDVSRSFGGLAVQIPIMLNMALSGMSYHSSDLGGFTGWASDELYIRWMEFGAFNPVMRAHGVDNQATEPWGFGSQAEEIARDYISLRYRLLPYIYTLARENYETGIPMVRPLFFHDPHDPALADRDDAYLLGRDLLVAPVVEDGQREKSVYLPRGFWVDAWTDSLYEGGQTITVDAPLGRLPLFVRTGAILPMQPVMDYVGEEPADTLLLQVYPSFSSALETFTLYEDDEESLDYMQGEYAEIPMHQCITSNGQDIIFEMTIDAARGGFPEMIPGRTVLASIYLVEGPPDVVLLGSDTLTAYPSEQDLMAAGDGQFYDAGRRVLLIKFGHDITVTSGIRIAGIELSAAVSGGEPETGKTFLRQNHPNPFRQDTSIGFSIEKYERVRIEVFNLLGQHVATLIDQDRMPGRHSVTWDGSNARGEESAPGIYFCRLSTSGTDQTRKMILVE